MGDGVVGFVGNVLIGGIIGVGIDVGSGVLLDFKFNLMVVNLVFENVED